jgi:hypothetical protein
MGHAHEPVVAGRIQVVLSRRKSEMVGNGLREIAICAVELHMRNPGIPVLVFFVHSS